MVPGISEGLEWSQECYVPLMHCVLWCQAEIIWDIVCPCHSLACATQDWGSSQVSSLSGPYGADQVVILGSLLPPATLSDPLQGLSVLGSLLWGCGLVPDLFPSWECLPGVIVVAVSGSIFSS